MKTIIDIIGTGLGPGTLTLDASAAITHATVVIGSPRLVAQFASPGQATVTATRPIDVIAAVREAAVRGSVVGSVPELLAGSASPVATESASLVRPVDMVGSASAFSARPAAAQDSPPRLAILMSGDVGFHSGATKVHAGLADDPRFDVRLIPGVSTVQFFAARLGLPWDDAQLVSCHGMEGNLVAAVRRHRHVIALTGGNVPRLADDLIEAGYADLAVTVGENLGQDESAAAGSASHNSPSTDSPLANPASDVPTLVGPTSDDLTWADHTSTNPTNGTSAAPDAARHERVTRTTVAGLRERAWSSLTVLSITNPRSDARTRSGIPDDEFTRGQVPMTKQAIRAHALAVLSVAPTDVCWDVGCGTGSVTIELALAAHKGMVWAVDKNEEAIGLTRLNCTNFHVGNARVAHGSAPQAMSDWPAPDVVFIGGTSGNVNEIVALALGLNPDARILVTAIAIESAAAVISALTSHDINPQITQLSAANGRAAGHLHLMMAQNPVTLVYGHRHA